MRHPEHCQYDLDLALSAIRFAFGGHVENVGAS